MALNHRENIPFAKRLAELRESKSLTKYRLAKNSGVSAAHIGQIERGTRGASFEVACLLADALGVSIELFRRK